ncbi:MAG: hypothetical protein JW966_01355 [Anaerolineae bacterium]|nr:hypothetical protein [Anaerolineae bacterium]
MPGIEGFLVLVGVGLIVIFGVAEGRRSRTANKLRRQINDVADPLFYYQAINLQVLPVTLRAKPVKYWSSVIVITPGQLAFYWIKQSAAERVISFTPDQLRWFGRPKKYTTGNNTIWLHVELDGTWYRVEFLLSRGKMQELIRVLKQVATPEQVTAYRRRRPYIHYGPVPVQSAAQDIHGAWTLGASFDLYLMPVFLLLLDGARIRRTIVLETVQKVSAIKRLDQPRAAGLVRFEVNGEQLAFVVDQHEAFAEALVEATKRTLEDPVLWQRKKKKGVWDDDEFDE